METTGHKQSEFSMLCSFACLMRYSNSSACIKLCVLKPVVIVSCVLCALATYCLLWVRYIQQGHFRITFLYRFELMLTITKSVLKA